LSDQDRRTEMGYRFEAATLTYQAAVTGNSADRVGRLRPNGLASCLSSAFLAVKKAGATYLVWPSASCRRWRGRDPATVSATSGLPGALADVEDLVGLRPVSTVTTTSRSKPYVRTLLLVHDHRRLPRHTQTILIGGMMTVVLRCSENARRACAVISGAQGCVGSWIGGSCGISQLPFCCDQLGAVVTGAGAMVTGAVASLPARLNFSVAEVSAVGAD
jgi:hypothetical protein